MKAAALGLSFFAWLTFLVLSPLYVIAVYLLTKKPTDFSTGRG